MNLKNPWGTTAAGLLVSTALVSSATAHTTSIGYENAGPGAVNFWYGSYHGSAPFNEGSLNLVGPGTSITVPFNLTSGIKPGGLIDGVSNFYTDGGSPPSLIGTDPGIAGGPENWQGTTFGGLAPGTYTFTYVPVAFPSVYWDPWDSAILSNMVTLTGAIIGTGDDSAIAATESAAAMTQAQVQDLRHVVRANHSARQEVAKGENTIAMSRNGPSTSDFSVWAKVGGGTVNADFGSSMDVTHFYGQAGVEFGLEGGFAVGVGVGGGTTSSEIGTENLDGEALFVQPYVAYISGPITAVASVAYTYTDYDDSTGVIDSGDRFTGSLTFAYDVPLDEQTSISPVGFLAGGWEHLDTSGSGDDLEFLIGRAGIELSHDVELLNTGSLHTYTILGGEFIATNEPSGTVPLLLTDYDDDRIGGRVELGFDFTIAGTESQFFANVYGSGLFSDAPGLGGNVGIKIPF